MDVGHVAATAVLIGGPILLVAMVVVYSIRDRRQSGGPRPPDLNRDDPEVAEASASGEIRRLDRN